MEPNATLDQASPKAGPGPTAEANVEPNAEEAVQQGSATRTSQANLSAALAAATGAARAAFASSMRFPGEDSGHSLAEMAQRDLDAALQLLADRAQYITGAQGAAIALKRSGKNDMLCRASTGSNAPELGALLSTQFGLSGESVRTRQLLRCDDAERDARVNREVCHEMGIASVVVMPVVQDDEVLGVFELFSGKVNAFGDRDLTALERLSEMVETAVRLANAAEGLPERLKTAEPPAESASEEILEVTEPDFARARELEPLEQVLELDPVLEVETREVETLEAEAEVAPELPAERLSAGQPTTELPATELPVAELPVTAFPATKTPATLTAPTVPSQHESPAPAKPEPPKRPLFWSLHQTTGEPTVAEAQKPAETDQSHVPPVLRNLRKCEACGFPISAGRILCVECEEKKWRGQLRMPQPDMARQVSGKAPVSGPAERAFAAAQSAAGTAAVAAPIRRSSADPTPAASQKALSVQVDDSKKVASIALAPPLPSPAAPEPALSSAASGAVPERAEEPSQPPQPEVVFSAGLESSQSWFARNKYVFLALLVVAAVVAAVVWLR
ncbi:MAG: GAF domain-containing protein [Terriglobales bacterium]